MTDRQKKGFLFNVIFIVRAGDGRLVGPGARHLVESDARSLLCFSDKLFKIDNPARKVEVKNGAGGPGTTPGAAVLARPSARPAKLPSRAAGTRGRTLVLSDDSDAAVMH